MFKKMAVSALIVVDQPRKMANNKVDKDTAV
jgi:hypothetical protein